VCGFRFWFFIGDGKRRKRERNNHVLSASDAERVQDTFPAMLREKIISGALIIMSSSDKEETNNA